MKLRIRSDGTPQGTRVEDENGEFVHGVQRVLIVLDVREARSHAVVTVVAEHDVDVAVDGALIPGRARGLFSSTGDEADAER